MRIRRNVSAAAAVSVLAAQQHRQYRSRSAAVEPEFSRKRQDLHDGKDYWTSKA
ncbi:hypothetical protein [Paenibacillus tianjinensis]|uniref:Uncharacterized protein n=1 Tax=Paenibacillus tianjinensis TaxID=2810347 RepID=A0ABX7LBG6_9BACL|nr:hypothetical protein [Paenibacillus tianjinensis]QSF45504.1 hypothetical protein JRJ22_02215 [Paenibacillus tianjinensis]